MAENPLLPGTDIEVIEKHDPGKRLDFPDFGSVCKTTFAKGTITDVKKLTDDPITVESMVKVTGDFGESDYIPLFYHPKAKYWDDGPIVAGFSAGLATDYNPAGYFDKAWMSFRCGDEVVVMLSEGKPVAVLGFADGKPKPGENILKLTAGPGYCFNALRFPKGLYAEKEKGPDGLSLGLTLECHKITFTPPPSVPINLLEFLAKVWAGELEEIPWMNFEFPFIDGFGLSTVSTAQIESFSAESPACGTVFSKQVSVDATVTWTVRTGKNKFEEERIAYLAIIGPILFWIDISIFKNEITLITESGSGSIHSLTAFCLAVTGQPPWCAPSPFSGDCLAGLGELVAQHTWSASYFTEIEPPMEEVPTRTAFLGVFAAVYTKELYERAKRVTRREDRPKELKWQFAGAINWHEIPNPVWPNVAVYENMPEFKMMVRPHGPGGAI